MKLNLQATKETLAIIVLGLIALVILIGGGIGISWYRNQQPMNCNVASVKLYGSLVYYPNESLDASSSNADQTAAEDIRQQIEAANTDPSVKAILL